MKLLNEEMLLQIIMCWKYEIDMLNKTETYASILRAQNTLATTSLFTLLIQILTQSK